MLADTSGLITDEMAFDILAEHLSEIKTTAITAMLPDDPDIKDVHRIMDFITFETILGILSEGVTQHQLAAWIGVPKGFINAWVIGDDNRRRLVHKALYAQADVESRKVIVGILQDSKESLSAEQAHMITAKLKAAKMVQTVVEADDPAKKDTGTVVHIDLGSALGAL